MDASDNVQVGDVLYFVARVDPVQRLGWHAWEYEVVDKAPLNTARGRTLAGGRGWAYRHGIGALLQLRPLHNDAPHQGARMFWIHPSQLNDLFHTSTLGAYQHKLGELYQEHQAAVLRLQRAAADLREIAEQYERQAMAAAPLAPYVKTENDDVHTM